MVPKQKAPGQTCRQRVIIDSADADLIGDHEGGHNGGDLSDGDRSEQIG